MFPSIEATFDLGFCVASPTALKIFTLMEIMQCLKRHAVRDWGELSDYDRKENDNAILTGDRILSVFSFPDGRVLWVITDNADSTGNRVCTACILPDDY